MERVLLLEDVAAIAKGIEHVLIKEGFAVSAAGNFAEAEEVLEASLTDGSFSERFALAILDVMLPDGSGFDFCRILKQTSPETAVIFLTAKDAEEDVVRGFDLGSDDYVVKPFRARELVSRVRAVLRRRGFGEEVRLGRVRVRLSERRVFVGEEEVPLTAKEFELLECLVINRGVTLSRESIFEKVWGFDGEIGDGALTTCISRLREKLGGDIIMTVKGVGYRVERE